MDSKKTIVDVIEQVSAALELMDDHTFIAAALPDRSAIFTGISDDIPNEEVSRMIGIALAGLVYNGAGQRTVQRRFVKSFHKAVASHLSNLQP